VSADRRLGGWEERPTTAPRSSASLERETRIQILGFQVVNLRKDSSGVRRSTCPAKHGLREQGLRVSGRVSCAAGQKLTTFSLRRRGGIDFAAEDGVHVSYEVLKMFRLIEAAEIPLDRLFHVGLRLGGHVERIADGHPWAGSETLGKIRSAPSGRKLLSLDQDPNAGRNGRGRFERPGRCRYGRRLRLPPPGWRGSKRTCSKTGVGIDFQTETTWRLVDGNDLQIQMPARVHALNQLNNRTPRSTSNIFREFVSRTRSG
jgi:hypothetical protein